MLGSVTLSSTVQSRVEVDLCADGEADTPPVQGVVEGGTVGVCGSGGPDPELGGDVAAAGVGVFGYV